MEWPGRGSSPNYPPTTADKFPRIWAVGVERYAYSGRKEYAIRWGVRWLEGFYGRKDDKEGGGGCVEVLKVGMRANRCGKRVKEERKEDKSRRKLILSYV